MIRKAKELGSQGVRPLGDFIRVRATKVGLGTVEALASAAKKSKQTVYGPLKANTPEDLQSAHADTLEAIATALRFSEWKGLVEAWRENDVTAGILGVMVIDAGVSSRELLGPLVDIGAIVPTKVRDEIIKLANIERTSAERMAGELIREAIDRREGRFDAHPPAEQMAHTHYLGDPSGQSRPPAASRVKASPGVKEKRAAKERPSG